MTAQDRRAMEEYMLSAAARSDNAHDALHIRRVLRTAEAIAAEEGGVDLDILTAACLLHDVARPQQLAGQTYSHALLGGELAEAFLLSLGWSGERAGWVRACIETHSYRAGVEPQSVEARILFDADKLDVTGALGVARTLQYGAMLGGEEPLYRLDEAGRVLTDPASPPSFFQEYNYKLRNMAHRLYTKTGKALAAQRQAVSDAFYDALLQEIQGD